MGVRRADQQDERHHRLEQLVAEADDILRRSVAARAGSFDGAQVGHGCTAEAAAS